VDDTPGNESVRRLARLLERRGESAYIARSKASGRSRSIAADPVATRQLMDWLTMTDSTSIGPTLRAWQKHGASSVGRWLFARMVCRRAPYFGTIRPQFLELRPTLCKVSMRRRRAVENHLGGIHALALGNLCELAAGMVTEVTTPPTTRWIPRGMTIEYLRKAENAVTATARLDKSEWSVAGNVAVPVSVSDRNGNEVVRAVITMHVTPGKA
jgi:acyl-coenzyme A thioesterase PaaI-like protein